MSSCPKCNGSMSEGFVVDRGDHGSAHVSTFQPGEPLPAEQAAAWGLIWKCVEDDALDAEVDALAARLGAMPPLGLAAIKRMLRSSWERSLDEELDLQRDEMRRLGFTDDYREGVAAFLEKRKPTFTGR